MVKIAKGAYVIEVDPYRIQVAIFTEYARAVEQLAIEGSQESELNNARAITCLVNDHRGCYLWAYIPKDTEIRTVVHESVHIAGAVFKLIGAQYDAFNDEPFAYLVDAIYSKLCAVLDKPVHSGKPKLI